MGAVKKQQCGSCDYNSAPNVKGCMFKCPAVSILRFFKFQSSRFVSVQVSVSFSLLMFRTALHNLDNTVQLTVQICMFVCCSCAAQLAPALFHHYCSFALKLEKWRRGHAKAH